MCIQVNGFKYCYLLFAQRSMIQELLSIVCTQLKGFKYCYLTVIILFNINHAYIHHNCFKYFYLTRIIK